MSLRTGFRRKRFQLEHFLGLAERGWFIPYRYRDSAPPPRSPYPEAVFEAAAPAMRTFIESLAAFGEEWPRFAGRPAPPVPRFDQEWFTGLDAAFLYGMVRLQKPGRIVEVGSGHSTRFAAAAIKDEGLDAKIHAIDPAPREAIEALAPTVRLERATIQNADMAVFSALQAGDILFIDSSHILMPGSDVDILFNRVLPRLAGGVIVHIHDVFLPDPYPPSWEWRGYNEQNAVACLLTGSGWDILAASRYAETRLSETVALALGDLPPSPPAALVSSLWLRKVIGP